MDDVRKTSALTPREEAPHERVRRLREAGKLVRLCLLVGTFALAAIANHAVGLPWVAAAFSGLQAFTLGLDVAPDAAAMDAGGWAPALVWLTRFAAPLLTAETLLFSAVLAGVIARPRWFLVDHVVLVGGGNLGRTVAEGLIRHAHEVGEHLEVVVVEKDGDQANLEQLREQGAWVVTGDGSLPSTLFEARVDRARAVVALTGHDVANIGVLLNTLALRGTARGTPWIHVQVDDVQLRRSASECLAADQAKDVHAFNVFDDAAVALAEEAGPRSVIAGYGRMGRALHRALPGGECLIVDRAEEPSSRGAARYVCGSVHEKEVLDEIEAFARAAPEQETTVFICTDDDVRNLDLALRLEADLKDRGVHLRLITRMLNRPDGPSALLDRIGARSLSDLVARRFARLATPEARWIGSARARGELRGLDRMWAATVRGIGRLTVMVGAT